MQEHISQAVASSLSHLPLGVKFFGGEEVKDLN